VPAQAGRAPDEAPGGDQAAARPSPPARRGRALTFAVAAAGVLVLAAAAVLVIAVRHHQQPAAAQLRPSGIPASVPTRLANLMGLSPVPAMPAPGFTLTDQRGHRLALSGFRGRAVVLTFLDTRCASICPLVSDEFAAAGQDLGPLAGKVVFAAVNVNPYHAAERDVAEFSAQHQLTSIPGWHFFTGPVPQLRAVWHAYQIEVQPRGPGRDTIHTSAVYFIDPHGRERYLAAPMASYTKAGIAYLPAGQIAAWGRGIALVAKSLTS